MALIHQGVAGPSTAALCGHEQIHVPGRGAKSVALVGQKALDEAEFILRNRHGPADAFPPQAFVVTPSFHCEEGAFKKKHIHALVHETASEQIGPPVSSGLQLGHPDQGSIFPEHVVRGCVHSLHCASKLTVPPRNGRRSADR
jgi:hypothetical protein